MILSLVISGVFITPLSLSDMLSSNRSRPPNKLLPNLSSEDDYLRASDSFQKTHHILNNIRNVTTISSEEMAQNVLKRGNRQEPKQKRETKKEVLNSDQQAEEMLKKYTP